MGGRALRALRQVLGGDDGEPAQRGRRTGPQPLHRRRDDGEVLDAYRQLVGRVQPVLDGQVVQQIRQRAVGLLEFGGQFGDEQRGRDAVLVAYGLGVDAVAQCLFAAEAQTVHAVPAT